MQPIRWRGDRLELLDQRALPDKTIYVTCRSAEQVAKAIRDMVVRGAPAIGCTAAFGVVLGKGSKAAHQVLAKSRPTAVNLFWALDRMKGAKDLEAEARAIDQEDLTANRTMEDVKMAQEVGGDYFIVKPFTPDALLAGIEKAASARQKAARSA